MKSIAPPITQTPKHSWMAMWLRSILIDLQIQHSKQQHYVIENHRLRQWQSWRNEVITCRHTNTLLHEHLVSSVDILIDELQKRNDGVDVSERRMIDIQEIENISRELRILDSTCVDDIGIKY